ncbi:uncharacterized protein LOC119311416 [Triticum dicoccoides]|uniref:uncharacterized protein LOC119311416 n=1 Tax=Triticum dicoccoides TaxID=85692 RepID=UPI000E7CF445|nr:uncharacterized protein LOC119311416 [Triticum dicoccoides]
MATSLRTVTSAMALRPSIAGPSLHGDGVPILYAIGALLASRSPSSVECNTNRAAASSSPGDCAPILSAIRSLVSSSSSSREGNSIRASSSGDGAPIMTAIRSLVSSSSSSREGNAILAANVSSAGDCSPIMSVIRALIGASSLSVLGSFSIYQGSAYASRELVPVYQGSAYGFRELVPASYRSFHPCKVLPASLTSNRNSSLMLVNILLGAWFGGYVLASTDGQPGSIILENLKEKLKLIEAEITDLERMIEESEGVTSFVCDFFCSSLFAERFVRKQPPTKKKQSVS